MATQLYPECKDKGSYNATNCLKGNSPNSNPTLQDGSPIIRAFGRITFIIGLIGLSYFLSVNRKESDGSYKKDWLYGFTISSFAFFFGIATSWFERSRKNENPVPPQIREESEK